MAFYSDTKYKRRIWFSDWRQFRNCAIAAGKGNEAQRWEKELNSSEKEKFSESFQKNFLGKLKSYDPQKLDLIKDPFILTINKDVDTVLWPHYIIKYDTLLMYPLPVEFDTLGIEYFEDLILSFAKHSEQDINFNQYHNLFRFNSDYSGYLKDSVTINSYYRRIGQKKQINPIFEIQSWNEYTADSNIDKRLKDYKELRTTKVEQGYNETV